MHINYSIRSSTLSKNEKLKALWYSMKAAKALDKKGEPNPFFIQPD
jgi:hypothetical protein